MFIEMIVCKLCVQEFAVKEKRIEMVELNIFGCVLHVVYIALLMPTPFREFSVLKNVGLIANFVCKIFLVET